MVALSMSEGGPRCETGSANQYLKEWGVDATRPKGFESQPLGPHYDCPNPLRTKPAHHSQVILRLRASSSSSALGCVVGGVPKPDHCVCLGTFLTLNDVEFHVIALFQSFVSIQLNCGVVNEYVWPVFTPDESVALGVVKPLDLSLVLSHRLPPSLHLS